MAVSHRTPKRSVVVLVGEPLAGKEIASQYLVRRHHFVSFRFSKILNDILARLRLPISRPNQTALANALRERFGGGILAEVIKQEIERGRHARVVIDGMRNPAEYEILKRVSGFLLVYLTAPLAVRYQRVHARREKVGEHRFSLEDFKRDEKLPNELFIGKLGRKAKVKIVNDASVAELYRRLEHEVVKNTYRLYADSGKKT